LAFAEKEVDKPLFLGKCPNWSVGGVQGRSGVAQSTVNEAVMKFVPGDGEGGGYGVGSAKKGPTCIWDGVEMNLRSRALTGGEGNVNEAFP